VVQVGHVVDFSYFTLLYTLTFLLELTTEHEISLKESKFLIHRITFRDTVVTT